MGSTGDVNNVCTGLFVDHKVDFLEEYGPNLKILPTNDQVKELQTILRDR